MTPPPGITISEAARLLGLSRPGLEKQVARDPGEVVSAEVPPHFRCVPGSRPKQLERSDVVARLRYLVAQDESLLDEHRAALQRLGERPAVATERQPAEPNDDDDAAAAAQIEALERELEMERTGRLATELRLDELKRHVDRLNAAVRALLPNPDLDLDAVLPSP